MGELYELFRRNFPFVVREEKTARKILSDPGNRVFEKRDGAGRLIGASVLHEDTVYLLCVDKAHRNRGLGGELLRSTESFAESAGISRLRVGAGKDYLAPGVPTGTKRFAEDLGGEALYPELTDEAALFFEKRGYRHAWGEANCFDMRADLAEVDFPAWAVGDAIDGITYRWASAEDVPAILRCTDDAEKGFSGYYAQPSLYEGGDQRVLAAALGGEICGVLIVSAGTEAAGLGSVGCTAVAPRYRGKHIAANLVILGNRYLRDLGLTQGFLGYTYSGLQRLYRYAGYQICAYYFMAEKRLAPAGKVDISPKGE